MCAIFVTSNSLDKGQEGVGLREGSWQSHEIVIEAETTERGFFTWPVVQTCGVISITRGT